MIVVSKNGRAKKTVSETTEILGQYGLSSSDNVTRRLIREGSIKATPAGVNAKDKRSGYDILERDIYKYIVSKIEAMAEIFPILEEYQQLKEQKQAQNKQPEKQVKQQTNKTIKEETNK